VRPLWKSTEKTEVFFAFKLRDVHQFRTKYLYCRRNDNDTRSYFIGACDLVRRKHKFIINYNKRLNLIHMQEETKPNVGLKREGCS
jgi:hypothetical protein